MAGYKPEDELSWNNRAEVLKLPVAPQEDPEMSTGAQNQTWNTTDAGPFKAIGYPSLSGVTIKSFFPGSQLQLLHLYRISYTGGVCGDDPTLAGEPEADPLHSHGADQRRIFH